LVKVYETAFKKKASEEKMGKNEIPEVFPSRKGEWLWALVLLH
jgi:hypothetical protein